MKRLVLIFIFSFLNFSICFAQQSHDYYPPEDPNGIYLELGTGQSPGSSWIEIGMIGSPSEYIEYRASFSNLGIEKNDDKNYFTGFNLGTRIKYSSFITPFIGLGIFTGFSIENTVDDEDKDNNDEKKDVVDDIIFCFYPESGFYFQFENNSRIYISSKYMITSEKTDNFFLFTIGFSFSYE